ncbi:MAG: 2-C-methyl-D-erythritol 4-phosphate cytidylyltransferase [Lachnospiraceae bacterium]|nr:2-C-methyl-D-erythritol 4-phosphate cytidylyltransferase [Lachnospiraceae bacterium]
MNIALLTAAGVGSRMRQDIPKQFLHIRNKPVILYTLAAFQKSALIDEIIVVSLTNWQDMLWAYAKQFNITKLKYIVSGGKTGQESIFCGLKELAKVHSDNDVVMVHDGNRPMVSQEVIADSFAVFKKYGSAVAAIPCIEAIFQSDDGISSDVAIPREKLWRTQTPHTYTLGKLLDAHRIANEKNIHNTTASCVLMQMLGEKIYFSKGSEKNLKITTMEDIEIFEAYLGEYEKHPWNV